MLCPKCQRQIPDGSLTCPICQETLAVQCAQCGHPVPADLPCCPNCGRDNLWGMRRQARAERLRKQQPAWNPGFNQPRPPPAGIPGGGFASASGGPAAPYPNSYPNGVPLNPGAFPGGQIRQGGPISPSAQAYRDSQAWEEERFHWQKKSMPTGTTIGIVILSLLFVPGIVLLALGSDHYATTAFVVATVASIPLAGIAGALDDRDS